METVELVQQSGPGKKLHGPMQAQFNAICPRLPATLYARSQSRESCLILPPWAARGRLSIMSSRRTPRTGLDRSYPCHGPEIIIASVTSGSCCSVGRSTNDNHIPQPALWTPTNMMRQSYQGINKGLTMSGHDCREETLPLSLLFTFC